MEAIVGIDLAQEARLAEESLLEEQRQKVRSAVSGIARDLVTWQRELDDKRREMEGIANKIKGAREKWQKLVSGDWSVLNENMLKCKPSSEKPTAA